MATQTGNVFELALIGSFLTNEVINAFQYRYTGASATAQSSMESLCDAFVADTLPPLLAIQSTQMSYSGLRVRNLSNGLDIYETAIVASGLVAGDAAPSFVALGITYYRETAITRNGGKRFAGLTESVVSGNSLAIANSYLTAIYDGLAATHNMVDDTQTVIGEFAPVIVGRDAVTKAYDLSRVNNVRAIGNGVLTTQMTRRAGHGS